MSIDKKYEDAYRKLGVGWDESPEQLEWEAKNGIVRKKRYRGKFLCWILKHKWSPTRQTIVCYGPSDIDGDAVVFAKICQRCGVTRVSNPIPAYMLTPNPFNKPDGEEWYLEP